MCSGATRIFTEWPPSLYRDDDLSIKTPVSVSSGSHDKNSRID